MSMSVNSLEITVKTDQDRIKCRYSLYSFVHVEFNNRMLDTLSKHLFIYFSVSLK